MKPYHDENCRCWEIVHNININNPDRNWDKGEACQLWLEESISLQHNDLEFDTFSDDMYCCTCPACGRVVCSWCV